jgi:hypothetical protein
MILVVLIGFGVSAYATDEYNVSVTITNYYEYYTEDGTFQFSEENGSESQTIRVSANSENEAKAKANQECEKICRGKEYLGIKTRDGNRYKVYRIKHSTTGSIWKN